MNRSQKTLATAAADTGLHVITDIGLVAAATDWRHVPEGHLYGFQAVWPEKGSPSVLVWRRGYPGPRLYGYKALLVELALPPVLDIPEEDPLAGIRLLIATGAKYIGMDVVAEAA